MTHIERVAPDFALATRQHAAYQAALASAGGTLIDLAATDALPDSTFVEDVVLAFPECFVLCRPGATSRAGEPDLIEPSLPRDRPVLRIEAPATIDGGDVLRMDQDVFIGLSSRTSQAGADALAALLAPYGYVSTAVRVANSLHLKTAATALSANTVLVNPKWIDAVVFGARRAFTVHPAEPFAGNALRVGDLLFMQAAHRQTAAKLSDSGMLVTFLDISEFAKLEAGLTCMSVIVPQSR